MCILKGPQRNSIIYDQLIYDPFKTLRSELMMTVIPTKMSSNADEIQAAMLHHLMQRLSLPTFLQREGQLSQVWLIL